MKKTLLLIILFFLFFTSRAFILNDPPYKTIGIGYSDVKADYERYANIWWYGLPPYLKHLFEYPPATIPLLSFPLFLDQMGIGKYYFNYRTQIFLIDFIFFIFLLFYLSRLKIPEPAKIISGLFYIIAGFIAQDFLYDGIDTVFSITWASCLMIFMLFGNSKSRHKIIFWTLFWLSFAIKLINGPLLLFYFFLDSEIIKKTRIFLDNFRLRFQNLVNYSKGISSQAIFCITGFLIIWVFPLLIFRSSLSVILFYNLNRSFKYCSFPYYLTETINSFSKTETKIDLAPDFSLFGPVSKIILPAFNILMIVAILAVILYGLRVLIKNKNLDLPEFCLKITLIYIFTFFLTSKIYSQPFPIWLIPLISIYPFKNYKFQVLYMILACFAILIDTTNLFNFGSFDLKIFIYPLTYGFIRQTVKFTILAILLYKSIKLPLKNNRSCHLSC